jgi:hypothetical protein
MQIDELKKQGRAIPQEVLKPPAILATLEGPKKPSRREQRDLDIQKSIDMNKPLVMAERKSAEEYVSNAKSITQAQIGEILLRIVEIKSILLLKPPRGSDTVIDKMTKEYKPLHEELEALDVKLEELRQKDDIEQGRIENTRLRLIAKEQAKEEARIKREEDEERRRREKQQKLQLEAIEQNRKLREEQELIATMTPEEKQAYLANKKAKETEEKKALYEAKKAKEEQEIKEKQAKEAKELERKKAKEAEDERLAQLKIAEQSRKLQMEEDAYRIAELRRKEEARIEKEREEALLIAQTAELERIKKEKREQRRKEKEFEEEKKKLIEQGRINKEYEKKIEKLIKDRDALLRRSGEIDNILANPGKRNKKEINSLQKEKEDINTVKILLINSQISNIEREKSSKMQALSGQPIGEEVDLSMIQKYLKYKQKYLQLKLNHIK